MAINIMKQIEFKETIGRFKKIEDARDQLWGRSKNLIRKGFETEAYILILATWNFAGFRFVMKDFKLAEFNKVINKVNPIFNKLSHMRFEDIDLTNKEIRKHIKFIYENIKMVAKQTGASKIMALKNSELFIMWDTEIRKMNKINNSATSDDYILFLEKMREEFKNIKWQNKRKPFAKAIDEYNYVIADQKRAERKAKKKAKK